LRGIAALALLVPSACGESGAGDAGGDGEGVLGRWVRAGGRTRTYSLFVPENPDARQLPLLIAFHGAAGTGVGLRNAVGLDALAARERFVVAYPDGLASWANGVGTQADQAGVDDVGFVRTLIMHLAAELPIDRDRVHVVGFSDGASLTYRLGCQLTGELASLTAVASGIPIFQSLYGSPSGRIAVQIIGGTQDQIFPWQDVAETARNWAVFNGCSSNATEALPDSPDDAVRVYRVTYDGCSPGKDVRLFIVEGGGHEWPGATWAQPVVDFKASEAVIEFSALHSRTAS
jgi:polyhydroxybutyrate depolymerase